MPENKKISDTFCILPYIHLSSRPGGKLRVCCVANASSVQEPNSSNKIGGGEVGVVKTDAGEPINLDSVSLEEAWNSKYMRNIRLNMFNNEIPAPCVKCFKEEQTGHTSKRMWETDYWSKRFDVDEIVNSVNEDGSMPVKLRYFDIRLGNKCQLACVMCSPYDSSGWIKDWKSIYPDMKNERLRHSSNWENKGKNFGESYNWFKNNPKFWSELMEQVPNMYQLYFAGGESFIIKEHYELLEECIKRNHAKNVELRYNSNAVEWRDDLFDLWKEFKRVRLHYSIDAYGEQNDYIRYPSDWKHQEEVFWQLDETSENVEVTNATAVSILNIAYLPEFVQWKTSQKFKKITAWPLGAGGINVHLVYWPPQLNVKVFPLETKLKIKQKYEEEFYPWIEENWHTFTGVKENNVTKQEFFDDSYSLDRFKGLINFMMSEDWSERLPETQEYLKLVNRRRKWDNKFLTVFPIFKDIM